MPAERFIEKRFSPLESEMLVAVRYDEAARHLDVIFRTGEKYRYKGVPPLEYQGLISANSHGQYMHKRILNRYDYERLD